MFWLLSKCVYRLWQITKQIGSRVSKRTFFIQLLLSFQHTHKHTLKSTVKLLFSPVLDRLKDCKQRECCFTGFCQFSPTVQILLRTSFFHPEGKSNKPDICVFPLSLCPETAQVRLEQSIYLHILEQSAGCRDFCFLSTGNCY